MANKVNGLVNTAFGGWDSNGSATAATKMKETAAEKAAHKKRKQNRGQYRFKPEPTEAADTSTIGRRRRRTSTVLSGDTLG